MRPHIFILLSIFTTACTDNYDGNKLNEGEDLKRESSKSTRDTNTIIVEIRNPVTGRTWMDRNLGASRAAISPVDFFAYGDLYQWGRGADGHQLRNSSIISRRNRLSKKSHNSFITSSALASWDWSSPHNNNLWQGVDGINNPCPFGYRLPTETEWEEERASWELNNAHGAFLSPLKLPMAGARRGSTGALFVVGTYGGYWSSTVSGKNARGLRFIAGKVGTNSNGRAYGLSVRCIKD